MWLSVRSIVCLRRFEIVQIQAIFTMQAAGAFRFPARSQDGTFPAVRRLQAPWRLTGH
jgi:hypothetical protein